MDTAKVELTEKNLLEFMVFYNEFHDATIKNLEYNIFRSRVALNLHVMWQGCHSGKGRKFTTPKEAELTLVFEDVIRLNIHEIDTADYIHDVFFQYITKNDVEGTMWCDKPVFVFALGKEFDCSEYIFNGVRKPSFETFIVCEKAFYAI